jgi:hypothetical protein
MLGRSVVLVEGTVAVRNEPARDAAMATRKIEVQVHRLRVDPVGRNTSNSSGVAEVRTRRRAAAGIAFYLPSDLQANIIPASPFQPG